MVLNSDIPQLTSLILATLKVPLLEWKTFSLPFCTVNFSNLFGEEGRRQIRYIQKHFFAKTFGFSEFSPREIEMRSCTTCTYALKEGRVKIEAGKSKSQRRFSFISLVGHRQRGPRPPNETSCKKVGTKSFAAAKASTLLSREPCWVGECGDNGGGAK